MAPELAAQLVTLIGGSAARAKENAERARSEDAERRRGYHTGCPVTFVTARPSASLSFSVRHGVTELLLIGR